MKTNNCAHAVRLLVCLVICSLAADTFAWSGKVVSVTDGDTIQVLEPGREMTKVRLFGIDTPEKAQAFGQKAKQFTADMVAGKTVDVETVTKDRYGRTVGIVAVDGKCLNEELVRSGYAWEYRQYCKRQPQCTEWIELEKNAQQRKIGLWQDMNPIPPWEWRKEKRK